MLRYEDLKKDTRAAIRKICKFLEIELSDDVIEKVYENTTFESMSKNDTTNYSWNEKAGVWKGSKFIRKGIVGDWKNFFSEELLQEFNNYIKERLPEELIYKDEE